jgi:predicted RNase H-like nuclease (RuvC/YqgF family)
MKSLFIVLSLLVAGPARAQQPTPAQTALQIDNVINQWAQTIEALQRENADLKRQIEEAKAVKPEEKK